MQQITRVQDKMLLIELFNKPVKYKWVFQGKYEAVASFIVYNEKEDVKTEYAVLFNKLTTSDEAWSVMFGNKTEQGLNVIDDTQLFDGIEIFSSLKLIINDFVNNYNVKEFQFSSENPKRINVYIRLFKKFLPNADISKDSRNIYSVKL